MQPSPNHEALFHIAETQAGYFTAKQARPAGFTPSLLAYHVRSGLFERFQRAVYRLKRFPGAPHEDLFVACLRVGPRAVVSHDSALALYDLSDHLPAEIHLTVPRTASRRHVGLRLHTSRLGPREITQYNGLRVTTVPRAIVDAAITGLADELVIQAVRQAVSRGLATPDELRKTKTRGHRRVRELIAQALEAATP
ncbi:MAG: type IV toxin-antitoxin system AbiEi family antitoxin domain-containing protein [Chloroflexota bacterium]